jgi:hypothetical protein
MARPHVADGGDGLQIWKVAANIINKQSRATDKGWASSLWIWGGANNSSPEKKINLLGKFIRSLGLGRILWINALSQIDRMGWYGLDRSGS